MSGSIVIRKPKDRRSRTGSKVVCSHVSRLTDSIFGRAEQPLRSSVLFTAAEPKAGVSSVASAVAAELAVAGRKVLLADAEVLASFPVAQAISARCQRIGNGRVWVLGQEQVPDAGYLAPPPDGQLEANLVALRQEFPFIVLDTPSLSESDVAIHLVQLVVGAVLVVREHKTETRELARACELLSSSSGSLLGCIYNVH